MYIMCICATINGVTVDICDVISLPRVTACDCWIRRVATVERWKETVTSAPLCVASVTKLTFTEGINSYNGLIHL